MSSLGKVRNVEIDFIEDKKTRLVFQLKNQSPTMCIVLKEELWNDDHVKVAGFSKRHPLIGIPTMIVETDGEDPRKVLQHAVQRLLKSTDKLEKEISREVKN